jgi:hypothetical protein
MHRVFDRDKEVVFADAHGLLHNSVWAAGRSMETIIRRTIDVQREGFINQILSAKRTIRFRRYQSASVGAGDDDKILVFRRFRIAPKKATGHDTRCRIDDDAPNIFLFSAFELQLTTGIFDGRIARFPKVSAAAVLWRPADNETLVVN